LIFSKLLDGLEAIHNSDTVHRDIKPENIMIGEDYKFKFVDLGFATKKSNIFLKKYMGTPAYAPPEIHLRRPYLGEFSDIFSLGITLFVLVTGSLPFRLSVPNDALYQFFVRNDYIGFWRQRRVKVSVSFMQLFDNLVAFDYTQRPSISEIRKSKWMQETDFNLEPKLIEELIRREAILNAKIKNEINDKENSNNDIFGFKRVKRDEEIYDCQKFMNDNKYGEKNADNNNMKNNNEGKIINNNVNKKMVIEKEKDKKEEVKIASLDSMKSIDNEVIKDNKIDNEIKIGMCIIVHNHNLNNIMTEICKYLKTKGFNNITKNPNELNINVSNEHIEVILYFHRYKKDIIKITYNKIRGTNTDLEQLKKMIKNLKFKT
jgi:serine/threonine protein kinase